MKIKNIKEELDGVHYYRFLRTLSNGKRYRVEVRFSPGEMQFRRFVARRLWQLRREIRTVVANASPVRDAA